MMRAGQLQAAAWSAARWLLSATYIGVSVLGALLVPSTWPLDLFLGAVSAALLTLMRSQARRDQVEGLRVAPLFPHPLLAAVIAGCVPAAVAGLNALGPACGPVLLCLLTLSATLAIRRAFSRPGPGAVTRRRRGDAPGSAGG